MVLILMNLLVMQLSWFWDMIIFKMDLTWLVTWVIYIASVLHGFSTSSFNIKKKSNLCKCALFPFRDEEVLIGRRRDHIALKPMQSSLNH